MPWKTSTTIRLISTSSVCWFTDKCYKPLNFSSESRYWAKWCNQICYAQKKRSFDNPKRKLSALSNAPTFNSQVQFLVSPHLYCDYSRSISYASLSFIKHQQSNHFVTASSDKNLQTHNLQTTAVLWFTLNLHVNVITHSYTTSFPLTQHTGSKSAAHWTEQTYTGVPAANIIHTQLFKVVIKSWHSS